MSPLPTAAHTPVIAIHGGAGTLTRSHMSAEQERAYLAALTAIVTAAQNKLLAGASAMDAVTLAVEMLEDNPLFNAGHGSVFTAAATHELDAAIMDGSNLRAGAVSGVQHVRNPVLAARAVLNDGQHVLMVGEGAETIARQAGLAMVDASYFSTEARLAQLHNAQKTQSGAVLDHDGQAQTNAQNQAQEQSSQAEAPIAEGTKMGTVGAVALDQYGHLAAATSTGGMTNKRPGRVGDSPLIGAGTYADDRTAAVSCTGHGESFIRVSAAYDVCARMAYAKQDLQAATHAVVHEALPAIEGAGGLIAISHDGQVSLAFNTEGMYRGVARGKEPAQAFIYKD